ncbi:unnamed protein product [Lepeophtheirus salmonis]|uniref:(salmon louse) hypothetical protein n=1 Tax=Lepeophtheirus salmonis TaxID=72036 RepID=A0A7R8CZH0_LEPSM|nr:unnamed protein product [Lepeophtheirus salmonis]CAF2975876.1 unnamed protein product [Lepeophtheirus salmonis]
MGFEDAVLASIMIEYFYDITSIRVDNVYAWTDSMILMHWINCNSSKWKDFVTNHVEFIQGIIRLSSWRYVRSADNPPALQVGALMRKNLVPSNYGLMGLIS